MNEQTALALAATRRLRDSAAFRGLSRTEQSTLGGDLDRIERALGVTASTRRFGDPYAIAQATPADLQRDLGRGQSGGAPPAPSSAPPPPAPTGAKRSAF